MLVLEQVTLRFQFRDSLAIIHAFYRSLCAVVMSTCYARMLTFFLTNLLAVLVLFWSQFDRAMLSLLVDWTFTVFSAFALLIVVNWVLARLVFTIFILSAIVVTAFLVSKHGNWWALLGSFALIQLRRGLEMNSFAWNYGIWILFVLIFFMRSLLRTVTYWRVWLQLRLTAFHVHSLAVNLRVIRLVIVVLTSVPFELIF